MIVHTDKEGFVLDAQREKSDGERTRICKGPWHYQKGKGTPLPISAFGENKYKPGVRTKTCIECLEKSHHSIPRQARINMKVEGMPSPHHPVTVQEPITRVHTFDPYTVTTGSIPPYSADNAGAVHKWRVTVIRPVEEIIYCRTYSEIPNEIQGEIIRVERLD